MKSFSEHIKLIIGIIILAVIIVLVTVFVDFSKPEERQAPQTAEDKKAILRELQKLPGSSKSEEESIQVLNELSNLSKSADKKSQEDSLQKLKELK